MHNSAQFPFYKTQMNLEAWACGSASYPALHTHIQPYMVNVEAPHECVCIEMSLLMDGF